MAATKAPRPSEKSTMHSTRLLLDELDALMEKMLALPVGEADVPAAPPPPELRLPTVSATLTVLEPPAVEEKEEVPPAPVREPGPSRGSAHLAPPPSEESLASPARWRRDAAAPPPLEVPSYSVPLDPTVEENRTAPPQPLAPPHEDLPAHPQDPIPPSVLDLNIPEVGPLPVPPRSLGATLLIEPVYWLNRLFDLLLCCLGPVGRGLRTARGRTGLGYAGLGLFVASALWLIKDWMGWTW